MFIDDSSNPRSQVWTLRCSLIAQCPPLVHINVCLTIFIWGSRQGFKTKYQNPWSLIIVASPAVFHELNHTVGLPGTVWQLLYTQGKPYYAYLTKVASVLDSHSSSYLFACLSQYWYGRDRTIPTTGHVHLSQRHTHSL